MLKSLAAAILLAVLFALYKMLVGRREAEMFQDIRHGRDTNENPFEEYLAKNSERVKSADDLKRLRQEFLEKQRRGDSTA